MEPRILNHHIEGDGDPVVLIPGGLTGWLSWIPHQQRLTDRYRVIRVQPIHNELGSAGIPGVVSYTRATATASLIATLDAIGIEQAHFAGWSAGGKGLIDFAAGHLDRVRSLTLVEPAAYWLVEKAGEGDARLRSMVTVLAGLHGRPVSEDDLATFLAYAGFASTPEAARRDPYWDTAVAHRTSLSWLSPGLMGSDLGLAGLHAIDTPTLVTKGTRTEPWEQQVADLLGEHLPHATVLELDGDHAHHLQSIDPFLEAFDSHMQQAAP